MTWKTDKRDVTFQKTANVTGFSAPADSVVSMSGGWDYDKRTNLLSVMVFGRSESGTISFDTKASTVPIGAFMYWDNSSTVTTFVKRANVSGADATLIPLLHQLEVGIGMQPQVFCPPLLWVVNCQVLFYLKRKARVFPSTVLCIGKRIRKEN